MKLVIRDLWGSMIGLPNDGDVAIKAMCLKTLCVDGDVVMKAMCFKNLCVDGDGRKVVARFLQAMKDDHGSTW